MSIKKSEVILKRFIDLKFSAWFTLGSEKKKTFFVILRTFFRSTASQGFQDSLDFFQFVKFTENIGLPDHLAF